MTVATVATVARGEECLVAKDDASRGVVRDPLYCGSKQEMVVVILKFDWVVWRSAKKKSRS